MQQLEESAKKVTKDHFKCAVELELVFYWGGGGLACLSVWRTAHAASGREEVEEGQEEPK